MASTRRLVVVARADDDYPGDYSPNGKRLVFLRASFETGPEGLFTVKLDGSGLRRLTPPGLMLDFDSGSWSPQGNQILFSGKRSDFEGSSIFVVHSDGSGLRQIPVAAGSDPSLSLQYPNWSPDGKKIAFTPLPRPRSDFLR